MEKPFLLVVSSDASSRAQIQRCLVAAGHCVESFASADDYLQREPKRARACLLLHLQMPVMNGDDLHQIFANVRDTCPTIFLADGIEAVSIVSLMKRGAADVVQMPVDEDHLLKAVHDALQREAILYEQQHRIIALRRKLSKLTSRELQVMQYVSDGKANKTVAMSLGISERTVETYRSRVMEKLDVSSVPELVRFSDAVAWHTRDASHA